MEAKELVLAALSPGKGALYSPVQVQKLLFLIDRNAADFVGGHHFDFQPYNYGPFDRRVYDVLEELAADGQVNVVRTGPWRDYQLTAEGQRRGESILRSLPAHIQDYFRTLSDFVRQLSFAQLVSAIYKAYPEMRKNSVFQG